MTVENISWSISTKECCRPRRGLNPRPPGLQSEGPEELRWLHQEIVKKSWIKLTQGVLFLQDNALAHTSQVAMVAATRCSFKFLPHPPYSPDLAILDFYLFPNLKTSFRTSCFQIWKLAFMVFWKQWRHHRCHWWVLRGSGWRLLFWRDKQTGTAEKVHRGKGRLYWEITAQFLLLVIPKVQGSWTFWSSLLIFTLHIFRALLHFSYLTRKIYVVLFSVRHF